MLPSFVFSNLKEAGDHILSVISRFLDVNVFCITNINQNDSYFISALNRHDKVVEAGMTLSVYEAY